MSEDSDGNSRSERLRKRRSTRSDQSAEQSEPAESSEMSKPSERPELDDSSNKSKLSERSESAESSDSDPTVKEERVGTYMYLHESQKREADRLFNVLKAEYEYEFEEEFEKNRHFYPLVVQYGLERLEGLDASEIRERLDSI